MELTDQGLHCYPFSPMWKKKKKGKRRNREKERRKRCSHSGATFMFNPAEQG